MSSNPYLDTRDLYLEWQELVVRADDDETDEPLDEEETERCKILGELFAEIGDSAGIHGGTMIPDSEFTAYAQELAEDIIADFDTARWPFTHVDWDAAADDLRQDYTEVTFDGEDYLWRE